MNSRKPLGLRVLALILLSVACATESEEPSGEICEEGLSRCGERCVDLESDIAHCGACGVSCGEDEICQDSHCVQDCPVETVACDGVCVDLAVDGQNCGSCGRACGEGEVCSKGACALSCEGDETPCGQSCVDLKSDAENCGACGTVCGHGETCSDGSCVLSCEDGEEACGGSCVDTSADAQHCGGCGVVCAENETCDAGACTCVFAVCGGLCTDTASDKENCGDCGVSCEGGPNVVSGTCSNGACDLLCDADHANCDGKAENGCETSLFGNPEHCGACNNRCEDGNNIVAAVCTGFQCQIEACSPGWGNCDENPANGCEAKFADDPLHCGRCGMSCAALPNNVAAPACTDGVCDLQCADGWGDCDEDINTGCETDLQRDHTSCGACGVTCDEIDVCINGVCVDPEWAQWPMPSDFPVDYVTDAEAGTVTDTITGLVWERHPLPVSMSFEDGKAYCRNLELGGETDWRLPTVIELTTLLHLYENWPPAIHEEHFPDAPYDRWYQTATPHASDENSPWQIDFRWGEFLSYPNREDYVRCVRGGGKDDGPRFVVAGETVLAPKSKLMWQRTTPATRYLVPAAIQYCENLVLEGHSDWRLPTMKELMTLVDRRKDTHTYEPEFFPDMTAGNHTIYASTSIYQNPAGIQRGSSWLVDFFNGTNIYGNDDLQVRVRCVREYEPNPSE